MTFIKEVPENIDELVKDANRKHSWKTRLSALNELRKYGRFKYEVQHGLTRRETPRGVS